MPSLLLRDFVLSICSALRHLPKLPVAHFIHFFSLHIVPVQMSPPQRLFFDQTVKKIITCDFFFHILFSISSSIDHQLILCHIIDVPILFIFHSLQGVSGMKIHYQFFFLITMFLIPWKWVTQINWFNHSP